MLAFKKLTSSSRKFACLYDQHDEDLPALASAVSDVIIVVAALLYFDYYYY